MSSTARDTILNRLRGSAGAIEVVAKDTAVMHSREWTHSEKIERFTAMLCAVHAEVHRITASQLIDQLSHMLSERATRNIMYATETPLGNTLDAAGDLLPERVRYAESIEAFKPALFNDVDAAVTTTRAGIAETGSLVLWPTVEEPRLMSLVPPIHIAVLEADRLYNTFHEAMTQERWTDGMPTNALLISGPSKTADIEQTLAYGVHGPKELIILLLESDA